MERDCQPPGYRTTSIPPRNTTSRCEWFVQPINDRSSRTSNIDKNSPDPVVVHFPSIQTQIPSNRREHMTWHGSSSLPCCWDDTTSTLKRGTPTYVLGQHSWDQAAVRARTTRSSRTPHENHGPNCRYPKVPSCSCKCQSCIATLQNSTSNRAHAARRSPESGRSLQLGGTASSLPLFLMGVMPPEKPQHGHLFATGTTC